MDHCRTMRKLEHGGLLVHLDSLLRDVLISSKLGRFYKRGTVIVIEMFRLYVVVMSKWHASFV